MDDKLFQEWSDALGALRARRSEAYARKQQEKADFSPADFFEIAASSLDQVLDQWLTFETRSAESKPVNVDQLRTELDGIFDFEVDAISRDMATVRAGARWDAADVETAFGTFDATTQELKKKYALKISGAAPSSGKKKAIDDAPAQPVRHGGGSGGGSGVSVISMFVIGLVLGAGPSVYFWDQTRQYDKRNQAERAKMLTEQRALEDSMALLHERFDQLATGKIESIPEIDRSIDQIRRRLSIEKRAVEAEYNRDRERLLKRTPAGARLDAALGRLEEDRNEKLAQIAAQQAQAIAPLQKQKNTLQELRVQ